MINAQTLCTLFNRKFPILRYKVSCKLGLSKIFGVVQKKGGKLPFELVVCLLRFGQMGKAEERRVTLFPPMLLCALIIHPCLAQSQCNWFVLRVLSDSPALPLCCPQKDEVKLQQYTTLQPIQQSTTYMLSPVSFPTSNYLTIHLHNCW